MDSVLIGSLRQRRRQYDNISLPITPPVIPPSSSVLTPHASTIDILTTMVSDLSQSLEQRERYRRLLEGLRSIVAFDAAALLQLDRDVLQPVAVYGLMDDTLGRQFRAKEHPRLAMILDSRAPVRFPADSDLPDPYDGLVKGVGQLVHVHDCLGCSLYIDEKPWGVLTLDAMMPGQFNNIDARELEALIALAAATVKAANLIAALEERVERESEVNRSLVATQSAVMVGDSPVMRKLKDELTMVAASDLSVLILGETGVGKELVASMVHAQSWRREQSLVHVNCAALPESIAESELFGHVKGAFSGALDARRGKFELADGGTLFLDEVGELPLSIQAKLLRALQSGEIQRVGSDRHILVDTRIVAATNRDLRKEVDAGRFRADLYHRLSVYPVTVPPLRERGSDILLLAGYLLEQNRTRLGCRSLRIGADAQRVLMEYAWPGNVRELEHVLSRASLRAVAQHTDRNQVITIGREFLGMDLETVLPPEPGSMPAIRIPPMAKGTGLRDAVDVFQRHFIENALNENDKNWSATARAIGVDRSNLHRLASRLGLK